MTMRDSRAGQRPWRWLALLFLPFALGGCLARVDDQAIPQSSAVATIQPRFFAATIAALPPSSPPPGRYTLGEMSILDPADPGTTYAAALLQPETKGLRLTIRADGLSAPVPPAVSYELVTASGIFRPLADGEWDRATAQGSGWSAAGTLVFIVPQSLHSGQLEIVDYYYPQMRPELQATPGSLAPLVRRIVVTIPLDRLP